MLFPVLHYALSLNLLAGNDGIGKLTILEAIHIVLTGLFCDRNTQNEISQYLFNKEIADI